MSFITSNAMTFTKKINDDFTLKSLQFNFLEIKTLKQLMLMLTHVLKLKDCDFCALRLLTVFDQSLNLTVKNKQYYDDIFTFLMEIITVTILNEIETGIISEELKYVKQMLPNIVTELILVSTTINKQEFIQMLQKKYIV